MRMNLGDARFTQMGEGDELDVGRLVDERHGEQTMLPSSW